MAGTPITRRRVLIGSGILGVAVLTAFLRAGPPPGPRGPSSNSIMVIAPYWFNGTWVFDDPAVGVRREPFVAGVPEMIDDLVKDIPDAREGFRLLFSAKPFPGYQKRLDWLRGDRAGGGNFYKLNDPPMEGWICPAMFKYYESPPKALYVKAEPERR